MFQIKKDETTPERRRIPILLVDETDGYTGETGVTSPTIYISKNGSVAAGAGTFAQLSSANMPGQYYYEFTAGEVDTLGYIQFYCIKSGTSRAYHAIVQINAYDVMNATSLGLSRLDADISSRSTLTAAQVNTEVDTAISDVGLTTTKTGYLDAAISSRSTLTAAQVNTEVDTAISDVGLTTTKTGYLDAAISSRSTLTSAQVNTEVDTALSDVGLTTTKTGYLDAAISTRSTLTAAQVNTEVDTALSDVGLTTTRTGYLDAAISTRLAGSSYTTPPTTSQIADAVWDEPANQHVGGGTFGKEIDLLKKANYTTEEQVTSDITPTTTTFSILDTNVTGFFDDQTLVFTSGPLTGQSRIIKSFTNNTTYSTIVVNDPLTSAPGSGAELVILSDHNVLPDAITEDLWNTVRATSSPTGGIPAAGTYGYFLDDRVSTAGGGGGGGGSASLINGPYLIKSENELSDDVIDVLVGSTGDYVLKSINSEGIIVPLSSSNTNEVKIYNSAGTLVETAAVTVNYDAGGIATFSITTTTTNTSGHYSVYLVVTDASTNVVKFGPLKLQVKAL